jgi:hypothetical protein
MFTTTPLILRYRAIHSEKAPNLLLKFAQYFTGEDATWKHCALWNIYLVSACPFRATSFSLWFLLPFCLQHLWTWSVLSACLSRRRNTNFTIFCYPIIATSAEVFTRQIWFSLVNYCMIYNYWIWVSTERIILYDLNNEIHWTEMSFRNLYAAAQLVNRLRNPMSHYVLARASHLFLPWTRRIQSTSSDPISSRSAFISSCTLHLGLADSLLP